MVDETHSHLFFSCQFSRIIWDNLKPLCKLDDLSCIWAEVVLGISIKAANNSVWSVIQRLTFGAAVYYIWQERNIRIFQRNFRTEENVFRVIVDTVRHKLMGLKIKKSREAVKAAGIWKISLHGINGDGSLVNNTGIDGSFYSLNSGRTIVICMVWVCWFCLGTGFWKCNQVFDQGECILGNLLCTTGLRIASCAGHQIVVFGVGWLCTTGTDPKFCAGILYFFMRSRMRLMTNETVVMVDTRAYSILIILSRNEYCDQGYEVFLGCYLECHGCYYRFLDLHLVLSLCRVLASPISSVLVSLLSMSCMCMVMFGTPLVGPFGALHVFRVCI
ncbi:reverse transcriptase domain, Reverse transcriptase zinc-binding domain protein [Artemisia annua]|uniref:Reverse transcriptase domain, Reverse transcriptase zinc-binding domain protein n=1 Tax=Artemisia annua TaxID=35608 RepID=A0A2U1NDF3_ARTAN|nr:reverse transcriptase domain, Reverse transcriptase zinc-binding domain protein [Artemisia annua]